jgi:sulfur carrier protein
VKILINGEPREVHDGASVAELIEELGLRPELVAIELNQALVRKSERAERRLARDDRIEIVTLVGGG